MPQSKRSSIAEGPPFLRKQIWARYHTQLDAGETRMKFENWLLDEVNAVEFLAHKLLNACEEAIRALDGHRAMNSRQIISDAIGEALKH